MEKRKNPKLKNSGNVVICLFAIIIIIVTTTTVIISILKHLHNSQEEVIKKMEPDFPRLLYGERVTDNRHKLNERFKLDLRENIFICQSSHGTGCPRACEVSALAGFQNPTGSSLI